MVELACVVLGAEAGWPPERVRAAPARQVALMLDYVRSKETGI